MDSAAQAMRQIMGHFATGVCVITSRMPDGTPCGVTINSLTSVSLTPALVLFCLSRTSTVMPAFPDTLSSAFRIHILAQSQEALSQQMTVHDPDWWQRNTWYPDADGCPELSGGVAWLRCHSFAHYDGGDHVIIVGKVVAMGTEEDEPPLLYHRGRYARLA